MLTLGVDMAAQPGSTAACLLRWGDGDIEILVDELGVDDDRIVELVASADAVGVDCPFGWPDAFVAQVGAYHRFESLVPGVVSADLRLRRTDHATHRLLGRPPLSVSTDKLGIVALRWIAVAARIGGPTLDRTGADGVLETYPGGSLTRWDIDHRGYKRGDAAPMRRAEVAEELRLGLGVDVAVPAETDDQLDAFICSLTARAHELGRTEPIPENDRDMAAREGWIRLPGAGSLPALAASRLRGRRR